MSVADLLDDFFESPEVLGVLSVSGVIGTWAGPRSPGTAFVMAHHKIGDVGDGELGSWGFPEGGMGGLTAAMASAARSFGAEIRTEAPVARIATTNGRVSGVVLESGEELTAPIVVTTAHPQISFLRLVDRDQLPAEFVADIERWNTRSGTVKVNVAVDRLPEFTAKPGFDPEVHGGTIVLARSLDEVEAAFQDAVAGRGATRPFADICIPSVFDPTLAPEGHHIVSMFSQWVPQSWAGAPMEAELDAYADRLVETVDEVAPGFKSSILHRKVIGPHEMEHEYGLVGGNIFHGELSPNQLFHLRPAAGYADFRTPIRGLYQAGSATHGGGGVTGIPALQAVRQIERDEKRARWRPTDRRSGRRIVGLSRLAWRGGSSRTRATTASSPVAISTPTDERGVGCRVPTALGEVEDAAVGAAQGEGHEGGVGQDERARGGRAGSARPARRTAATPRGDGVEDEAAPDVLDGMSR